MVGVPGERREGPSLSTLREELKTPHIHVFPWWISLKKSPLLPSGPPPTNSAPFNSKDPEITFPPLSTTQTSFFSTQLFLLSSHLLGKNVPFLVQSKPYPLRPWSHPLTSPGLPHLSLHSLAPSVSASPHLTISAAHKEASSLRHLHQLLLYCVFLPWSHLLPPLSFFPVPLQHDFPAIAPGTTL